MQMQIFIGMLIGVFCCLVGVCIGLVISTLLPDERKDNAIPNFFKKVSDESVPVEIEYDENGGIKSETFFINRDK